jgi:hypothetical protein
VTTLDALLRYARRFGCDGAYETGASLLDERELATLADELRRLESRFRAPAVVTPETRSRPLDTGEPA